jgi:hypothetical protein
MSNVSSPRVSPSVTPVPASQTPPPATPDQGARPDAYAAPAAASRCPFAGLVGGLRAPATTAAPASERRSAVQQQTALYERVCRSAYAPKPPVRWQYAGLLGGLRLLGRINFDHGFRNHPLKETFASSADVWPERTKVFHPYGVVGAASFEPADGTPFTGVFASGALALIRLSLAADTSSYTPGAAIKLFVDNRPSLNIHTVPGLDPQTSRDFFAREFTNWIAEPTDRGARALEGALAKVVPGATNLPVTRLARVDSHGAPTVGQVVAPVRLVLRGVKHFSETTERDFREELSAAFAPGDTLFDVFGIDARGQEVKAGRIVLTQPLMASSFGDRELHFQHNAPPAQA